MKEIVWIASYPKSGNTWVRLLLDAYYLGEVDINDMVSSVSDDNSNWHQVGDGSDVRKFPVQYQQLTRPMALLRLVRQYQSTTNDNGIHIPLFVKTHSAHLVANGIELLPECLTKAVIYIVRDPRDVLPSFAKHMGLETDEAIDAFLDTYRVLEAKDSIKVADLISSWPKHVGSFINGDTHNIRVFRYEDLKSNPVETFAQMLEHAGVKPDMDRVRKAVEITDLAKLKKQESEKGFRESSPYAKDQFFGGERKKLTPRQVRRIEKGCQSMLRRLYLKKAAA